MEKSQWYIGAPNGVVICVDGMKRGREEGRFYCQYRKEMVAFHNMDQLLIQLEKFFDGIDFPQATTAVRSFGKKKPTIVEGKEKSRVMTDEEMLGKHGDLGTFVVRVQHRQHNSWQGRITWMEENRSLYFRSAWEMVKLIESALNAKLDEDELEKEPQWFPD